MAEEIMDQRGAGARSFIEYTASASAIRGYGIPVAIPFGTHPASDALHVLGADGHDWKVWSADGFFVNARRPRTEAEETEYIDRQNARLLSGFFSKDRQLMCAQIADHIQWLAETWIPPRDKRKARKVREKIAGLAWLQTQLLERGKVDMAAMRAKLAVLGVHVSQPDLMVELEDPGEPTPRGAL